MEVVIMRRILVATLLVSCGPRLPKELIANHPRIKVEIVKPQVVEASAPIPPVWTRRIDRGAVDHVPFAGQSSAGSMDAAQQQAMDDLLAAVSNFVSVEVESEFEAIESEKKKGTASESELEVHSSVKTRSRSKIEGVKADEVYWEKVLDSPLSADAVSFRVYVHASVPKSKIARARLERQLERQKKTGRKMVVVLPFRPQGTLSNAFLEEVSRRLNAPDLAVGDPGLIAALLASEDRGEAEVLETVRDALLPDFVVGGSYQVHEGRVRATYTLYSAPDGRVLETRSFEKKYDELFALQDEMVAALSAKLSTAQSSAPIDRARPNLEAWALHHLAGEDYAGGKNDQAIEKLKKALQTEPSFGEAHLRLGHVYERLGRYGRVPAPPDKPGQRLELYTCVPWSRISDRPIEEFLSVREGSREAVEGLLEAKEWEDVDLVWSAIDYVLGGGHVPEPPVPAFALSAVGAYWYAFRIAKERQDERGLLEAEIALADLFVRVDRYAAAERLYRDATARAETLGSIHHQSLAWFGLGRLARIQSRYELAGEVLRKALRLRSRLGEKPYLLEIYNELGNWSVELSLFSAARIFYTKALRLADELDQDYFRAVLANNVGVLLIEEGRFAEAERYLLQAFDRLRDLGEAEAEIASGLNLHLLGASRGDRERARAYLEESRRLILKSNRESQLAELHAHRGFLLGLEGERLDAIRDLLRSWALYSSLDRPLAALRLANDLSVAEFYESAESGRLPTNCLRDRWHKLLEEGWGWDESRLADDYYWWYRRGDSYRRAPLPVTIGAVLGGARGATYWYTLLNAEVMARLSGGGW
jgi:tetratricopeptide (TPR) repeat protein